MEKVNEGEAIMIVHISKGFLLLVCLITVWGCANTQPTHFYLLRAIQVPENSSMVETTHSDISLGLGPISIPKYLERPQIVTRVSTHEINLAEFHKWAAPLKENVSRVLEEHLSAILATEGIVPYPWNRSKSPEYQLSLDIIQLDGIKNQEAILKVRWALAREEGREVFYQKTSQFSEIIQGSEYEGVVEAMSRMFSTFSQEIADAMNALPRIPAKFSRPTE